ncbi:MAG: hypothetical protein GY722_29470 [bacterium]|nr:hypothetical protein [bacterium]
MASEAGAFPPAAALAPLWVSARLGFCSGSASDLLRQDKNSRSAITGTKSSTVAGR